MNIQENICVKMSDRLKIEFKMMSLDLVSSP